MMEIVNGLSVMRKMKLRQCGKDFGVSVSVAICKLHPQ